MTFSAYPRPSRRGDVYRLEFPDGKSYVGASLLGAKRRYQDHKRVVLRCGFTSLLYAAWALYGDPRLVMLKHGVLEKDLWSAEKKAIAKYDTKFPNGYNGNRGSIRPPGHLGFLATEETKKRLREAHLGKKDSDATREKKRLAALGVRGRRHSVETRKRMSETRSGVLNSMFGRHHSNETKEKIRLSHLGMKYSTESIERRRLATIRVWEDRRRLGKLPNWKKPSKPCANCSRLAKPLRKGLCSACAVYFSNHGVHRSSDLITLYESRL